MLDDWREFVEQQVAMIGPPFYPMEPESLDRLAAAARRIEALDDPTLALGQEMTRNGELSMRGDDPGSGAATDRLVEAVTNRVLRKRYGGRRPQETDAERREFLDSINRELFGRDTNELSPEALKSCLQTMSTVAVLTDDGVMTHWDRQQQLVNAGAVGLADWEGQSFEPEMSQQALQLLRAVLRREMRLRGLTPPDGEPLNEALRGARGRLLDGRNRLRALAAVR
jgi:hypothetical protein